MDIAFLIVRIIVGLGLAAHGAQKLFGWFGGHGLTGTGQFFEGVGFRPGRAFATAAGLGEFVGGSLIFLGLAGALGPALCVLVMLTAIFAVHLGKGTLRVTAAPNWRCSTLPARSPSRSQAPGSTRWIACST